MAPRDDVPTPDWSFGIDPDALQEGSGAKTISVLATPSAGLNVPGSAVAAKIQVRGGDIVYRDDGGDFGDGFNGHLATIGTVLKVTGRTSLLNFLARLNAGGPAFIDVTYYIVRVPSFEKVQEIYPGWQ